ncbi:LysR substrate-binding domain-containing protein [Streptomyces sp. DSM 41014]|uniref:LysR substrate-binding domain-containing protein n=1 Tax=Streptomyces hintoniae TaxID=3075521 RepID=A0ABU2UWZ7_9ACTN|nr:LysR substrate-binding domain-containing protein [Streptomyces sp. DSM 41014]MDT0477827.1 LysR substrate-binding domain-containing protein [Streptomyces sp. DSM 41014]
MLDVRRLRLLRELSLRGTIAAVAEALAFTPSAVSQQLSALEREAGVPLLERTGRRVTLTPAGQKLVHHAEAIFERLEQATADLVDTRRGLAGPLRIGTFPTATRAIVLAALASLVHQHPGLEPMVLEIDPAEVAGALRAGDLDVALIHEYDFVPSPAEPGLAAQPLCTESMYLASTSSAPGEAADGWVIGHWKDSPWITATPGTLCHAMTVRACQAAGFTPHVRHQVDDFATVLALVAAGQGVAVVPHLGIVDPMPGVTLTRLPIHRRTKIAYRTGAAGHPAVAATAVALRGSVPRELTCIEGTPLPRSIPGLPVVYPASSPC